MSRPTSGSPTASRSALASSSRAVATRPRRPGSRTPATCCARPAGGSATSGGTRPPTPRCRSTARWRGSATSWRPRPSGVDGPVLVVGKSLGTYGARLAAERAYPAIWLTPVLTEPELVDGDPRQPGPAAARRRHGRPPVGRRRRRFPGRRRVRRTPARRPRPRPHRPRRRGPLRRGAASRSPARWSTSWAFLPLRDGCNAPERPGYPVDRVSRPRPAQCRRSPSESSAMLARSEPWPSVSARLKEALTSFSASSRPTQLAPSTDLPGSSSL